MSPHVAVSVSWVMSASSTVFSPTLACHCILSPALNLAQCPTDILQGMGNRHITSGFEENLKCPISSFNVLSLCFVPTQWGRGNPFSLIVNGVRFTSHSLSILNRCFAMSWTVTRPGSSLTPHLESQRPPKPIRHNKSGFVAKESFNRLGSASKRSAHDCVWRPISALAIASNASSSSSG